MISLVIIVEVAEGKADLFVEYITEEARDVMADEPGCRSFFGFAQRRGSAHLHLGGGIR